MENWRRRKELAKGMKEEMPERLSPSVARKIERRLRLSVGDDGGVVGMGMESRVKKGISLVLGRKRKRASDQMDSVLFGKFPLEVREMIYGYVLAGASHLHIYRRADRRMGHYVCGHTGIGGYGGNLERKSGYCAWEHLPRTLPTGLVWSYDETVTGAWDVRRSARREEDKDDLLGLLLACKRVYVQISSLKIEHIPHVDFDADERTQLLGGNPHSLYTERLLLRRTYFHRLLLPHSRATAAPDHSTHPSPLAYEWVG